MTSLRTRIQTAFKDRKIVYGFTGAPLALLLISIIMILLAFGVAKCAHAAAVFDAPPYVFLGLDYSAHGGLVCYTDAVNGAEANLGAGIPLLTGRAWEINAQWTHHSCAFDDDRQTYDGLGLQLRWYPTLWVH